MTTALSLISALLLPLVLGIAVLAAMRVSFRSADEGGEIAWLTGAGFLLGAFLLTVSMRALSVAGIRFSVAAIALPCLAVAVACLIVAWRRGGPSLARAALAALRDFVASPGLARPARIAWCLVVAWLAIRFALLAVEVLSRPLYPWDAWTQWATKARVYYELGRVAPFARVAEWLAANGAVYFDASPEYPPTMPLLQTWTCLVLGRWDDVLMNAPWWAVAVALALVVYGGLRSLGASSLAAVVGSLLVSSLPLANVHVALAGYADLPMAVYYTAAAIAVLRWNASRRWEDAAIAVLFAVACTQIKNPGWFWALTLVPGVVVALAPRIGVRLVFAGFAVVGLLLVALARFDLRVFNYQLKLDFVPAWGALAQSYFLLGNWNLLWYAAIGVAVIAHKELLGRALAPFTLIVAAGLVFLFVVFGFTTATYFISDQTTVNRATLHLAPLIVVFIVLAWQAFARRWAERIERSPARAA